MRIVFWGTPQTAVPFLERLLQNQEVVSCVTQTDKPADRGHKVKISPVKEVAQRNKIPLLQPAKLKDPEFLNALRDLNADCGIVVAYGRLIPKEAIEIFPKGLYNAHFSLLPQLRGAAPLQRAILQGLPRTGISIFHIEESLDSGPILVQKEIPLGPEDDAISLENKLIRLGLEALDEALSKIESGDIAGTPQKGEPTFAPLIKKEEARILWDREAEEIARQVRAFARSGAFCFLPNGKTLKVFKAQAVGDPAGSTPLPGQICGVDRDRGFLIKCLKGALLVEKVQPEAKSAMGAWPFLQGHRLSIGERFS